MVPTVKGNVNLSMLWMYMLQLLGAATVVLSDSSSDYAFGHGSKAYIYGSERVREWLSERSQTPMPTKPRKPNQPRQWVLGTSGIPNSGTNALYETISINCRNHDKATGLTWGMKPSKHMHPTIGRHGKMYVEDIDGKPVLSLPHQNRGHYINSSHPLYQQAERIHNSNWARVRRAEYSDGLRRRVPIKASVPCVIVRHPVIWLYKSMCRRAYFLAPLKKSNAGDEEISGGTGCGFSAL